MIDSEEQDGVGDSRKENGTRLFNPVGNFLRPMFPGNYKKCPI